MSKKSQNIYQFKITLEHVKPSIWRRIQIPATYTFWDFHVAIQDVMGWDDYHLHAFEIIEPQTGRKIVLSDESDEEFLEENKDSIQPDMDYLKRFPIMRYENEACIASYFSEPKQKALYEYDFGDSWKHKIVLEKILPLEPGVQYPRCLAGKRACPPEDCGGIWGYEELLEIMKDPFHEEHKERMEWLGDNFDPENFNPDSVKFSDPKKRWKMRCEEE